VITLLPRPRRREDLVGAPGKLLGTMISVTAAGLLDPVRFRRRREYATSGAVTAMSVDAGILRATIQGSRREPYSVEVRTATVPALAAGSNPATMPTLAPGAGELRTTCTCPDAAEGTCKHAAAALLAFADEVSLRPDLLVAWRCADGSAPARAAIGSRRRPPADRPQPPAAASPFETDEWRAFVAAPAARIDLSDVLEVVRRAPPPAVGNERLGAVDLSGMVRSALAALRAAGGDVL